MYGEVENEVRGDMAVEVYECDCVYMPTGFDMEGPQLNRDGGPQEEAKDFLNVGSGSAGKEED